MISIDLVDLNGLTHAYWQLLQCNYILYLNKKIIKTEFWICILMSVNKAMVSATAPVTFLDCFNWVLKSEILSHSAFNACVNAQPQKHLKRCWSNKILQYHGTR